MYLDKQKARNNKRRIKENTLLLFVFLGGWIGGYSGMKIFKHKTKKNKFVIGIPLIIIFEILCIIFFIITNT